MDTNGFIKMHCNRFTQTQFSTVVMHSAWKSTHPSNRFHITSYLIHGCRVAGTYSSCHRAGYMEACE